MKHALLIFGAAALFASGPALASPKHGKSSNHAMSHHGSDHGKGQFYGYGRGGCPPGLAKKNNGCMPRGQFKKMYRTGQRYGTDYGNRWSYNQIPTDLRSQYNFSPNSRYYYGDGYLYQVNPRTMLIQQVVNAIMR